MWAEGASTDAPTVTTSAGATVEYDTVKVRFRTFDDSVYGRCLAVADDWLHRHGLAKATGPLRKRAGRFICDAYERRIWTDIEL